MALKQRPVSKTTYRLQPIVTFGIAAFVLGFGTFVYFNFGHSVESFASTISSFPYSESFESDLGDWTQSSTDDFDWTIKSGSTPSNHTGPSSANDGSYYLYLEADGNIPSDTAILEAEFDFSSDL